jgi:hypothetical protein
MSFRINTSPLSLVLPIPSSTPRSLSLTRRLGEESDLYETLSYGITNTSLTSKLLTLTPSESQSKPNLHARTAIVNGIRREDFPRGMSHATIGTTTNALKRKMSVEDDTSAMCVGSQATKGKNATNVQSEHDEHPAPKRPKYL